MQRTVRSDFARPIRLTPSGRPRQEPEGSVIKGQPATAESEETSPPVKASRGSIGQAGPPASTTQRSSDLAEQMCGCVCGGVCVGANTTMQALIVMLFHANKVMGGGDAPSW